MRRSTLLATVVASAMAITTVAAASSASAAELVANGGFESGVLAPWSCSGGTGSVVTNPVRSGGHALSGGATASDNARCAQTVQVAPNSPYTLTAWVRGAYVFLGVTGGASTWTPSATNWTQLTVTGNTGSATSLEVYLHGWYGQGTYYADDVSLSGQGGTVQPPATPTGLRVTATTSSSVSLAWNASAGALTYTVRRDGANPVTVSGTSTTVTGLSANTSYTFTVSAANGAGSSPPSAPVTATTTGGAQVPPPPGTPNVTAVTCTSVSLSWSASAGATSYRVYRGSVFTATSSTTSATITGLTPNAAYTFRVSAVNAAGESAQSGSVSVTTPSCPPSTARSWPYIDVTAATPSMASVAAATGHRHFTAAFVIGSAAGCVPTWGGTIPLTDSRIRNDINAIKASGGDVAIAFGGAVGPYLEHVCGTQAALANAYKQVIDALGVTHLDIDIEAAVNVDMMNKALAQVQRDRPGTVISFTLMVQGDDYGLTPQLGYDLLVNAKANGVDVAVVNAMTMEFGSSRPDWGDAVIAAANATLGQLAQIWPEKTDAQRRRMLGVTPMIGRNFNGRIFQIEDANQLVAWANASRIGLLAFWSVGRDNGSCPGGGVSPTCSSLSQSTYQFTNIFKGFTGGP